MQARCLDNLTIEIEQIEIEQEEDGRWIAEILEIPSVLVYGDTQEAAIQKVRLLARQVIDDKRSFL